jgi:hypothetical protein
LWYEYMPQDATRSDCMGSKQVGSVHSSKRISTSTNMHQIWKRIWKIKGPRMVKMFMWQACSNILPTRENLFKRKVTTNSLCPICQTEVESVGHALWSCQAATDVWLACLKRIQKTTCDEDVFLNIFEKLLGRLEEDEINLVACVARQIWLRRNRLVFEGVFSSPMQLIQNAKAQMEAAEQAEQEIRRVGKNQGPKIRVGWKAPPAGMVKCNWDMMLQWM